MRHRQRRSSIAAPPSGNYATPSRHSAQHLTLISAQTLAHGQAAFKTFELGSDRDPSPMTVIDKTMNRALNLVGEVAGSMIAASAAVADKVGARGARGGKLVTLTIARPRREVEQLWRDPAALSRVLGTVAEVS
jgi:hypothetical protein